MTEVSGHSGELTISRAHLTHALKTLVRQMAKQDSGATLRFADCTLLFESGRVATEAPANGDWPAAVFVTAEWLRRIARNLPAGDPVHLRFDEQRIYVNRYAESRATPAAADPPDAAATALDDSQLISDAACILARLHIRRERIEEMVQEARARGPAAWRVEEKQIITLAAKAWTLLAPLGIETADIRRLVDSSIRDAWRTSK